MKIQNLMTNFVEITLDGQSMALPPGFELETLRVVVHNGNTYQDHVDTNYTVRIGQAGVVVEETMSGQGSFEFGLSSGLYIAGSVFAILAAKKALRSIPGGDV
jgi:hypothetical protein